MHQLMRDVLRGAFLESLLVQALSNGARLELGGACGADLWLFENARKHAKSRTAAENIAYRTNQRPVGAQEF